MKNAYIISSAALKWCKNFNIPVGSFYQDFYLFLESLSSNFNTSDFLFKMYKFQKTGKIADLITELEGLIPAKNESARFICELVVLSLRHSYSFGPLYEVFDLFGKKIKARKIFIKLACDLSSEDLSFLKSNILEYYEGKVSVQMSVDNKLIKGWIVYNDFVKTDSSLLGKMERLVDGLSV